MSEIAREEEGSKGRWFLEVDGETAEMTYSRLSPAKVIVDHTGVPDALRGRGLGLALAERMVADMRAEGSTVVALCPFVRAQAARRPEWGDVVE